MTATILPGLRGPKNLGQDHRKKKPGRRNRRRRDNPDEHPRGPAYYWWFLANSLAACFAIISWLLCLDIFRKPEVPRNYEILHRLERLPELKRYTVLDVPNGNALAPGELFGKFAGLGEEKRKELNGFLLRNYLRNFERSLLLTYIEGDYEAQAIEILEKGDFLYPGFAIRARAMVKPDDFTEAVGFPVMIEYLFPTENIEAASAFKTGDTLSVKKNPNCAAVIHTEEMIIDDEPGVLLSVIPIAYGPYRMGGERSFSIEPPERVNPSGGLPVFQ